MPIIPERDTRTQKHIPAPTLLGPHTPDLFEIIRDLQRRLARLESKVGTH